MSLEGARLVPTSLSREDFYKTNTNAGLHLAGSLTRMGSNRVWGAFATALYQLMGKNGSCGVTNQAFLNKRFESRKQLLLTIAWMSSWCTASSNRFEIFACRKRVDRRRCSTDSTGLENTPARPFTNLLKQLGLRRK